MWEALSCIIIVEPLANPPMNISMLLPFASNSLTLICVAEACVALFQRIYPDAGSPLVELVLAL